MVTSHSQIGNATQIIAQDPDQPGSGSIALMFTANPTTLRQWIIMDDLGQQTTIILGDLKQGVDYPPSVFSIDSEVAKRNR